MVLKKIIDYGLLNCRAFLPQKVRQQLLMIAQRVDRFRLLCFKEPTF